MTAIWPRLSSRFDLFGWYEACSGDPRPKAWVSAFAPAEILLGANVLPLYPENHAAMLGALSPKRDHDHPYSEGAIARASEAGLATPPLCSYALSDLGVLLGADSPLGSLPGPDLFYACDSQCRVVERWGDAVQEHFRRMGRDVPHYVLHAPRLHNHTRPDAAQQTAFTAELRTHLDDIAIRFDTRLEPLRLAAITAESAAANALWRRTLALNRDGAAVWCMTEAFAAMAPIVVARGHEAATDFYRVLLAELLARPAPASRPLRLLWDGIPIWPRKNWLADHLADHDAIIAASTYTHSWSFDPNPDDAWDSLVARYAVNTMSLPRNHVGDWLLELVRDYRIDGVIGHRNRSCSIWNSYVQANARRCQASGIPHLTIDADMVDARYFHEQDVAAQLATFITDLR